MSDTLARVGYKDGRDPLAGIFSVDVVLLVAHREFSQNPRLWGREHGAPANILEGELKFSNGEVASQVAI
eukprot:350932-Prorocentrum_minimum.AAC.1